MTPLALAKKWHEAERQFYVGRDAYAVRWKETVQSFRERQVAIAKIFLDNEKKGKVK